jgi:uncharacterized protein DUF4136
MNARMNGIRKSLLLAASFVAGGLGLAGCDEHVEITRNRAIPVLKHQTWAWRPAPARREAAKDERPVTSRDVPGGRQTPPPAPAIVSNPSNDTVRDELRTTIERHLTERGLTQVSDPAVADFVVSYHFAIRKENMPVARAYPGGYPGLVCGPYGCYQGWGYGPPEVGYENLHFREGTFVFDLFTRAGYRLAYRAVGVEPPHSGTFSHDQVDSMVKALLKGLKPSKG